MYNRKKFEITAKKEKLLEHKNSRNLKIKLNRSDFSQEMTFTCYETPC